MVQRVTRSACSGGFTNSSERDYTVPVGLVLRSSSGKLHGLLRKLSEGSDQANVGGKGFGHNGCPRAALAGRGEVTGAVGKLEELGVVQRRQRGRWPCTRVGFIATARVWARGGRGRVVVCVRACSGRAPECQPTSNTWWFTSVRVQRPIWSP
jgi:hypothetical protein